MNDEALKHQNRPANARFATTHWSVVIRAGETGSDDAKLALGKLIETYWYPLYAFARRRNYSDHDAKDITQAFFAQMLAADALESVAREKGRFRSFLLASFTNFMANERRAASAIRRGGQNITLSMSGLDLQARYDREPVDHATPEILFQKSWVESLLSSVRTRLLEDYKIAGKQNLFELLEPHLTNQPTAIPRTEISQKLKLSPAAVAMSLHRMRRRYGELLREQIAATVDDPCEIEDELRDLMEIAGRAG